MSNDSKLERRKHGCDGCHMNVPTERFDGYCDHNLWLCNTCYMELIKRGIHKLNNDAVEKEGEQ